MKSSIEKLQVLIRKCDKNLLKLSAKEKKARSAWTAGYHTFINAAKHLASLRIKGTKIEQKLKSIIGDWDKKTVELTKERDLARKALEEEKEKRTQYEIELSKLVVQSRAQIREVDEIVDEVFKLNETVVIALERRNNYLGKHVYHRLLDEKGNMRSQISFISSDGLRKVVALVNTITKILPEFAEQAKNEIEKFFSRFQEMQLDENTKILYELTRKLLVERTTFKIGPDLYRFLSLDLDASIFPELKKAKNLLEKSLRSEKTESYIRLYTRITKTDKWEVLKQS
jgi:hypothetical protein